MDWAEVQGPSCKHYRPLQSLPQRLATTQNQMDKRKDSSLLAPRGRRVEPWQLRLGEAALSLLKNLSSFIPKIMLMDVNTAGHVGLHAWIENQPLDAILKASPEVTSLFPGFPLLGLSLFVRLLSLCLAGELAPILLLSSLCSNRSSSRPSGAWREQQRSTSPPARHPSSQPCF